MVVVQLVPQGVFARANCGAVAFLLIDVRVSERMWSFWRSVLLSALDHGGNCRLLARLMWQPLCKILAHA